MAKKKKRGPGRPPGSKNKKKTSKRVGRPKGTTTKKRGPGRPKGSGRKPGRPAKAGAKIQVVLDGIDGRTSTLNLVRVIARAESLLSTRDAQDIDKLRAAMKKAEDLKKEYGKVMDELGEDIPF